MSQKNKKSICSRYNKKFFLILQANLKFKKNTYETDKFYSIAYCDIVR
jgi:hypothetical protein